jgi:preprotein translocase subunit SecA
MLQRIGRLISGDPIKKELKQLSLMVDEINQLEPEYEKLSDEALRAKTDEFRARLASDEEDLDDLLPEAFAAVREASKRTIGLRHFDVQMIGGIVLHQGKIAEMRTGEGKTLVATLPVYLNAISGKGVHLVTVNDYLARRDARWMAPIYQALGLTVGVLQMAARTDNGRNAFVVDLEKTSPHEDQHQLRLVPRNEAYLADITYGTNSEFGFDYLRDNTAMRLEDRVQRGHNYAIVDEVDNILIDEARTPLIISGPASEDTEWYYKMAQIVRGLYPEDYEVAEKDHTVSLTEIGEAHVEQLLGLPLSDPERPEDITPEQARLRGFLEQALRAQHLFRRNKEYLVQAGKVVIVDEFTGRLMPGRRWSDGLHQAVEAKEGVKVEAENVTYATITIQNYFRMYAKLAGMTGTALTEGEEFYKIYKLDVTPIPTNLEYQAMGTEAALVEVESRDDDGYKYSYFSRQNDQAKAPVYWRRKDFPDVVYRTEEAKLRAITREILYYYVLGRPQLVGTTSVEHSERLSERLRAEPIRRLLQTMLLRDIWLEKNNRQDDERTIPELLPLYKPVGDLNTAELRQMARSLDASLSLEEQPNLGRILSLLHLKPENGERLVSVLQGGIPHQVLNARKHDEESQIIARAGAFGAVTIATNMAGRGVDIKLGGELPEETLGDVNRVIARAGRDDAYDMRNEERRKILRAMNPEDYGIYAEQVQAFLQYMDDMERVRALGGLHIIGSERHEARRIDNQLRGRAARQGDPGSSRFYLSLGDDLMRLFGGQQVEGLLNRLNIDEAMPIESGIVGRLVEQSQTRVEGSNFDVRKHLLEYDDVLNSQRVRIYSQRDAVFTKEDLSEDVTDMLSTELQTRIPTALKDEEGPWKLLAYLDEIQPTIEYEDIIYPSFTQYLLLDKVEKRAQAAMDPSHALQDALLDVADQALNAEREHLMRSAEEIITRSEESLQTQLDERNDALDTFLESVRDNNDPEVAPRRPQEIAEELAVAVRLPIRMTPDQMRQLASDPETVVEAIRVQVKTQLTGVMIARLIGSFERRLEESLNLKPAQFQDYEWNEAAEQLLKIVEETFNRRSERLLGEQGQIARDLTPALARIGDQAPSQGQIIQLLNQMAQGARIAFDRKTHRQTWERTTRLRYIYLAARLLGERPPQQVTDEVLEHLEGAQDRMAEVWGRSEWTRMYQNETTLSALVDAARARAVEAQGEAHFNEIANLPLAEISPEDREVIQEVLGRRVLSEIYRQLLLGVISELWVDYLTRVEALRVSIGLEAYAQRDPLVQYKSRATEMFGELLAEIRIGVISRMFTFRPRTAIQRVEAAGDGQPQAEPQAAADGQGEAVAAAQPQPTGAAPAAQPGPRPQPGQPGPSGKKKRRRH